MKTIKLENRLIVPVFQFLQDVSLKGKASRGRTQLLKRLEEKSEDFNEALTDLRKEYFELDEDGELKVVEGKYIFKDKTQEKELSEKIKDLDKEEFEIHFGEYSSKYEALFTDLDNLGEELSGQKALAYDALMTAYEENEEEK